jgi:hypothetical protein
MVTNKQLQQNKTTIAQSFKRIAKHSQITLKSTFLQNNNCKAAN